MIGAAHTPARRPPPNDGGDRLLLTRLSSLLQQMHHEITESGQLDELLEDGYVFGPSFIREGAGELVKLAEELEG